MKCEPLKIKKQKLKKDIFKTNNKNINEKSDFYLGFQKGVDDSFNEFASYIDLFNRYKNNVKLLMNEQKEVWVKFVQYYEKQQNNNTSNYISRYNNWLFNYIFLDIDNNNPDDFLTL